MMGICNPRTRTKAGLQILFIYRPTLQMADSTAAPLRGICNSVVQMMGICNPRTYTKTGLQILIICRPTLQMSESAARVAIPAPTDKVDLDRDGVRDGDGPCFGAGSPI